MSSLEALANLIEVYLKLNTKKEPAIAVSKELSLMMLTILSEMLKYYEVLNESKDS